MALSFRPPCDEQVIRAKAGGVPCGERGPWVLAATIVGSAMVFTDGAIVNIALPVIQRDLSASMRQAQWLVEIYLLLLSALILVGGGAGDRFGRRRVFAVGVTLFGIASLWCGVATDITQLIAARALQGIGGALLAPGSLSLISANFRDAARGRAIGTWSGVSSVTAGVGPVLGGWLIEHASWHWAFLINLPLAVFVLFVLFWRVPESRDPTSTTLDLGGATIVTVGLGLLVYGLIEAGSGGGSRPLVVAALVGGPLALIAFVWHESRARAPMVPLRLFQSRAFSGANLLTLLLYAAISGVMFFFPFLLMQVHHYTATAAGAAMLPFIVIVSALSRWSGGLVSAYGARLPLTVGPVIAGVGLALLAVPGLEGSYWTTFFPGIVAIGFGMAIAIAPLTTTVMNAVDDRHAGVASGINNAVARTAGLLAVAVFSLIVSKTFNRDLDARIAPMNLPHESRAILDHERPKLAGADIPPNVPHHDVLVHAIDESFVHSFRILMLIAAGLAIASAATANITLSGRERHRSVPTPAASGAT